MKKVSLQSLVSFIDSMDAQGSVSAEILEVRDEIKAELNKGKAKAEANKAAYADYHVRVMDTLKGATASLSAQEIADETGIARGKLVYGLTNYWADEVEKDTTGKTTLYRIKV